LSRRTFRSTSRARQALLSTSTAASWVAAPPGPRAPGLWWCKHLVPHFLGLLGEAKQRACKAVWYAKWFVHRALRPEAYGGLVHMTKTKQTAYPLNRDILDSEALARGHARPSGTYFLPRAFPKSCAQHPSYAQGHASMAGACATILKAAVDGSVRFNALDDGAIVTANADGTGLVS